MKNRTLTLALAALLAAGGAHAQTAPRRPALPAQSDTNDASAYYRLGMDRLSANPREAADAFWWASRLDPHWADPLYARRAALLMSNRSLLLGYYSAVESAWRQAMPADSLVARALEMDPFLQRNLEGELARAYMDAAIERATRGGETRDQLTSVERAELTKNILGQMDAGTRAWLAAADGDLDHALEFYALAIRQARYKSELYADQARVLAQRGDLAGAVASLDSAVATRSREQSRRLVFLYQSKAQYQQTLGALHERMGHADLARTAYGAALQEDLSFAWAHAHMASLSLAAGDTAGAVSELALAVQIRPDDPALRVDAATVLALAGHVQDAVKHLEKAVELDPYYADPYVMLGRLNDASGITPEALRYYDAYLAHAALLHPQHAWVEQRARDLRAAAATP